jgi:2,3-dimethylmalate lyase
VSFESREGDAVNVCRRFRELLDQDEITLIPGAFDPLAAKLIARNGFAAAYMTGAGTALARFGLPDVGLLTMTEMVSSAAAITGSIDIPVVADADTGYGNELNVRRTVREYERAGVAAIHIEDQVMPKKCGHLSGKRLISLREMASKVQAACEARSDPDFTIIARCDALAIEGMDEVVRRCNAYIDAGADALFIEALTTVEQVQQIPSMFSVPTMLNVASSGKTPFFSATELQTFGYRLAILPNFTTLTAMKSIDKLLATIKSTGDIRDVLDDCATFTDFMNLAGLPEIQELERHYEFDPDALTSIG